MIRNLLFFIREACIGMKRSFFLIVVAKATIFVSLVVFGVFLIINANLLQLSDYIYSRMDVRVFLKETLTKKEINYFRLTLQEMDMIQSIDVVDRKESWSRFKKTYEKLDLDDFIEKNPLPHSLEVRLHDGESLMEMSRILKGFSYYVDDVVYGGQLAHKLEKMSRFIVVFGWSLVILLSFATFLIMVNTIRLTVLNRSEEISVMRLVGATDSFITGPFLMEGVIIGGMSSLCAVGVIHTALNTIMSQYEAWFPFMPQVVSAQQIFVIYGIIFLWGTALSILGVLFSLRGTLRKTR